MSVNDELVLLRLRGIEKHWGSRAALDGIALEVNRGSVIRIKGDNGAGKTTLLRIVAGLLRPDAGVLSVGGLTPEKNRADYLARVGFLSTGDRGLYARLTARRHLELSARLAMVPSARQRVLVEDAVRRFGLVDFADRRVERTSTGQRQRTRLAMALLHDPELVLLDEPTNSLDDLGIEVLIQALEGLRRRRGAAIWCVPNTAGLPIAFDQRYVLAGGELRAE